MSLLTDPLPAPLEAVVQKLIDDDMRDIAQPSGLSKGTTRNDYGYYMAVLGSLPQLPNLTPKSSTMLWGIVLVRCGANEQGVRDAIRVMH